jgi:glycosyltransferase involved in cell wall biosynthesis
MKTLVSVIIPTHNRLQLLQRAVQSVLTQTFQDFEIIIVDDASSDRTPDYLQGLASSDERIRFIRNDKSCGGSQSRNAGIALSGGEWLAFLDDDDLWLPEKLALQLDALNQAPGSVAVTSHFRVNYPLGIKKVIATPHLISLEKLLRSNSLGGASVCMCRADLLKSLGGFDSKLRSAQDWDVWVRLREVGEIISVPKVLVEYFIHFSYRISNDMRGKESGARRFYFKYRGLMSSAIRRENVAFLCYIRSRQARRTMMFRFRYLRLAIQNTAFRVGRSYFISSFLRILVKA